MAELLYIFVAAWAAICFGKHIASSVSHHAQPSRAGVSSSKEITKF